MYFVVEKKYNYFWSEVIEQLWGYGMQCRCGISVVGQIYEVFIFSKGKEGRLQGYRGK